MLFTVLCLRWGCINSFLSLGSKFSALVPYLRSKCIICVLFLGSVFLYRSLPQTKVSLFCQVSKCCSLALYLRSWCIISFLSLGSKFSALVAYLGSKCIICVPCLRSKYCLLAFLPSICVSCKYFYFVYLDYVFWYALLHIFS